MSKLTRPCIAEYDEQLTEEEKAIARFQKARLQKARKGMPSSCCHCVWAMGALCQPRTRMQASSRFQRRMALRWRA